MSDMKCPFCKEELSYAQEIDGGFEILTCDCPHGIWLFGNDKMWCSLEKLIAELDRTRKALDVAVDALKWIDETYQTGQEMEAEIWGKVQFALQKINNIDKGE